MNKTHSIFVYIILTFLLFSCRNREREPSEEATAKKAFIEEVLIVKVAQISSGAFDAEIISNGRVYAFNKAEIKFPFNEQIETVLIRNGEYVKKGQILATLDATELKKKLSRSRENLAKATVELDDRLIDYGYRLKDSTNIPEAIMRMASIKSGYNSAQYDYVDGTSSVRDAKIVAPFSGKVANVEAQAHNMSVSYKNLCTLIDDTWMRVEFSVLETEYRALKKGALIEVIPFGEGITLMGVVAEINPMIDDNGMIKIFGKVQNKAQHLLDGMNVRVIVKNAIPNKLYIPKTAIVQRQDREVVFTYENGHARWNYVETGLQNSKYVIINSGLDKNKLVIVNNNFNLAHDSEVRLDKLNSISD